MENYVTWDQLIQLGMLLVTAASFLYMIYHNKWEITAPAFQTERLFRLTIFMGVTAYRYALLIFIILNFIRIVKRQSGFFNTCRYPNQQSSDRTIHRWHLRYSLALW